MEWYKGKEYETILTWVEDSIGFVQLNRPKAYNALNPLLMDEAYDALNRYSADPDIRAIIICGNEKAFAAGADLKAVARYNAFEARDFIDKVHRTLFAVEDNHKPTIGVARGVALGGGLELFLACDIHIVAEDATLGLPEINLGIFPGGGGTQRFPRQAAINIAKQYIFTGDFFDAETAYRIGIANMVVPADEAMDAARKIARKICRKSPLALREAKNAVNMSMNTDIKTGCRMEQIAWSMLFSGEDQKEGMQAFLENRKAEFKGK
ncbi:MAG TPA: enoyl-CoA hydratase/isomerase family protein [Syntrophomonadaceae bacterium]|nr:enoyl-CoA hydratase/isomerase family protein [Syntrophomonadaceae bacterium]